MRQMPWFRMWNETRTDPKLETLTDAQHRVWHRLLCYASEQETRGVIAYRSIKLLAIQVARGDVDLLNETLMALVELEIIDHTDASIAFLHWINRQYDKPSDAPEATRERKDRSRSHAYPSPVDPPSHLVTPLSRAVTPNHALEEKERRGEGEKRSAEEETIPPAPARETPPPPPIPGDIAAVFAAMDVPTTDKTMASLIVAYAPKCAQAGLVIADEAAMWADKTRKSGKTLSAISFKKWLDNEIHPDRPKRQPPPPPKPPRRFQRVTKPSATAPARASPEPRLAHLGITPFTRSA